MTGDIVNCEAKQKVIRKKEAPFRNDSYQEVTYLTLIFCGMSKGDLSG